MSDDNIESTGDQGPLRPQPPLGANGQVPMEATDADGNSVTADMFGGIPDAVDDGDGAYADLPQVGASLGLDVDETDVMEEVTEASIGCRKPSKKEVFRTHPDPAMTKTAWVFVDDESSMEKVYYLPTPEMRPRLMDLLTPVRFHFCQNTKGQCFVWAIVTDAPDGKKRTNSWRTSSELAARVSRKHWTAMVSGDKQYKVYRVRKTNRPDPVWPPITIVDALVKVFAGDKLIRDDEHPIVQDHGHRVEIAVDGEAS